MEKKLIENAVIAESFIMDYVRAQMGSREQIIDQCNELIYKTAKESGKSIYEICANFVPEVDMDIKQPSIRGISPFDRNTMSVVTTIKLKRII